MTSGRPLVLKDFPNPREKFQTTMGIPFPNQNPYLPLGQPPVGKTPSQSWR